MLQILIHAVTVTPSQSITTNKCQSTIDCSGASLAGSDQTSNLRRMDDGPTGDGWNCRHHVLRLVDDGYASERGLAGYSSQTLTQTTPRTHGISRGPSPHPERHMVDRSLETRGTLGSVKQVDEEPNGRAQPGAVWWSAVDRGRDTTNFSTCDGSPHGALVARMFSLSGPPGGPPFSLDSLGRGSSALGGAYGGAMARSATYRRATVEIRRSATIGRAYALPSSGSSQGSFSSCPPYSIQEAALRALIIQRSIDPPERIRLAAASSGHEYLRRTLMLMSKLAISCQVKFSIHAILKQVSNSYAHGDTRDVVWSGHHLVVIPLPHAAHLRAHTVECSFRYWLPASRTNLVGRVSHVVPSARSAGAQVGGE
ncbi:hypothetical protein VTO73DRAFT_5711 [Trametes versicolor]